MHLYLGKNLGYKKKNNDNNNKEKQQFSQAEPSTVSVSGLLKDQALEALTINVLKTKKNSLQHVCFYFFC